MEGPIKEYMSKTVISIPVEMEFLEACKKFTTNGIHHLPVVDNANKLLGMFSSTDAIYAIGNLLQPKEISKSNINKSVRIKDVMTSENIEFLQPEDAIAEAIVLLQQVRFNSIPILEDEKLVGIITSYDLFKAFRKELK